jgi:glycosyltransferase involved in cell wall biosynthesis
MRIAYLCYLSTTSDSGVSAKIGSQLTVWRRLGHEATLYCAARQAPGHTGPGAAFRALERVEREAGAAIEVFATARERVSSMARLEGAVIRSSPDVVYLRYDLFTPPPVRLLGRVPTVVECNTDDVEELRLRSRAARIYNRASRRAVFGRSAGIVFVTHELAASAHFTRFGKPALVLGNGIDLDSIASLPPTRNEEPQFAFLGEPNPWQGIDRVVALATALPQTRFDLVGPTRVEGAPPNLQVHGVLGATEYREILARCDVGLGTLALYRKGMAEASPLKVREYLAHGLPTIIGYEDTDFVGADPWFLERLPNTDWHVGDHLERIYGFARAAVGRRVPRAEIAHLDATMKEARRLAFLEEIASTGPS